MLPQTSQRKPEAWLRGHSPDYVWPAAYSAGQFLDQLQAGQEARCSHKEENADMPSETARGGQWGRGIGRLLDLGICL